VRLTLLSSRATASFWGGEGAFQQLQKKLLQKLLLKLHQKLQRAIFTPLLDAIDNGQIDPEPYECGSRGPASQDAFLAATGRLWGLGLGHLGLGLGLGSGFRVGV